MSLTIPNFEVHLPKLGPNLAIKSDETWKILNALRAMETHLRSSAAALALYSFAEDNRQRAQEHPKLQDIFSIWKFIASRDVVMSIYHFRREMQTANDRAIQDPDLGVLVDKAELKAAHRLFVARHPYFEHARNAVSHAGDIGKTDASAKKHSTRIEGTYTLPGADLSDSELLMQDNLFGNTFVSSWDGKAIQTEISPATLDALVEVATIFYGAFKAILQVVSR